MNEAVEDCAGDDWFAGKGVPFVDGELCGDHG